MSNSRRVRRHLHTVAGRCEIPLRDLSTSEVDEVVAAWEDLTDDVVRLLMLGDLEEASKRANAGRHQIATRYGGVSLLVGPVTAATSLARHVLQPAEVLAGIRDMVEAADPPLGHDQLALAMALVHGIVADAGGLELAAPEALVLLMNDARTDSALIAAAVWLAFCHAGAEEGVGATWCADADDDVIIAEEADALDEAVAARGAAAALVGLVGADDIQLARALASSVAHDILLPDGVAACLALLDLDREPEKATVSQICQEATERRVDDAFPVDAEAEELLRLAARAAHRVGGGEGAGMEALERLEQWLVTGGE